MRLSLVPRQTQFYALFSEAGENVLETARLVQKRFGGICEDGTVDQEAVKAREHDGDRITGEIIGLLNTQYITPLDRDDIYALATAIDDVVDYLDDASELIDLYRLESPMEQAIEQCRVLVGAAEHLRNALRELRTLRGVSKHLVALKQLEDEGDAIARDALGALFEDESISPRLIIQWKDIFEALEASIDSCETAAHLIGNIVVKGS
jgi:predicted phosphate transport protein (TIGR00153 family)